MTGKVVIGIQAREESERLPGKVLFPLGGKAILDWVVEAAEKSGFPWYVLTTTDSQRIKTMYGDHTIASEPGVSVTGRFLALRKHVPDAKYVVRLCGDQPFVPSDRIVEVAKEISYFFLVDYVGYLVDGVPAAVASYGTYPEVVSFDALERAEISEHVTQPIYSQPDKFKCRWIGAKNVKPFSLCVDTLADYYRIMAWYENIKWQANKPIGGDPYKNFVRYPWWQ